MKSRQRSAGRVESIVALGGLGMTLGMSILLIVASFIHSTTWGWSAIALVAFAGLVLSFTMLRAVRRRASGAPEPDWILTNMYSQGTSQLWRTALRQGTLRRNGPRR